MIEDRMNRTKPRKRTIVTNEEERRETFVLLPQLQGNLQFSLGSEMHCLLDSFPPATD